MITFPGLNLYFNVSKIAFSIFNINIYYYAVCIVFGIIVSLIICRINCSKYEIKFEDVFDCFIFAIVFGIIGARIYYCIFNLDYYLYNPLKIFSIRDGGLAIYGGIIFGALAIYFRCKKLNIKVLDLFNLISPSVAIGQSIGRWGNFFNQEAYGYETNSIFRMGIQTVNGYKEVHPTFLYESISTFIIFIILLVCQKNTKLKGQCVYIYLLLYSFNRMFIEALRTDSLMVGNLRISQILSIAIFVVSSIILLKKYKKYIFINR